MPFFTPANKSDLREGFSSGSAAAAAAFAAVNRLLGGAPLKSVNLARPPFQTQGEELVPENPARLNIPLARVQAFAQPGATEIIEAARAVVIKDGGDDPDVTHGLEIEVRAARSWPDLARQLPVSILPESEPPPLPLTLPLPLIVFLHRGPGLGLVTLPGLPVKPGEAAVNPEPRKQIAFAAREAARRFNYNGPLHLWLQVPQGQQAALKTLNPRLGIKDGISILGTQGTVRPYSHQAWQATILQGLDVARALGQHCAVFSTGRRSERALQHLFPQLPPQVFVQAADFAKFSLTAAAERGFRQLIWGCYPGKLLKLAQGLENTHASEAAPDLAALAALVKDQGGRATEPELLLRLRQLPTASGAFSLLEETDAALALNILTLVANMALENMRGWLAARPGLPLALYIFRNNHSLWLKINHDE